MSEVKHQHSMFNFPILTSMCQCILFFLDTLGELKL